MADLEKRFPGIPWAEPQALTVAGGESGYVCRICVAKNGLKASDGPHFKTLEEGRVHIAAQHPEYLPAGMEDGSF